MSNRLTTNISQNINNSNTVQTLIDNDNKSNIQKRKNIVLLPLLIDNSQNYNNDSNMKNKNNNKFNSVSNALPILAPLPFPPPLLVPTTNSLPNANTNNNLITNTAIRDINKHVYPLNEPRFVPSLSRVSYQNRPLINSDKTNSLNTSHSINNIWTNSYPTPTYGNSVSYRNYPSQNLSGIIHIENSNNNIPQVPSCNNNSSTLLGKNLISTPNSTFLQQPFVINNDNVNANVAKKLNSFNTVKTRNNIMNMNNSTNKMIINTDLNTINSKNLNMNNRMNKCNEHLNSDNNYGKLRINNNPIKVKHKPKKSSLKQCPVCGKNCFRPSSLKIHYLTHTGETPYHCTWENCNKAFNVKSNLGRHLKLHQKNAKDKKVFELPQPPPHLVHIGDDETEKTITKNEHNIDSQ